MRLTLTIAPIVASSLALSGCVIGGDEPPPVTSAPRSPAVCEALRPSFPHPELDYDSEKDTPLTVSDIRVTNKLTQALNARFRAACP